MAGVRTVVLTRRLAGATAQHYTFNQSDTAIQFIDAVCRNSLTLHSRVMC